MGYALGIDLGTCSTAAAVLRWGEHGLEEAVPVALGAASTAVPSLVHLSSSGEVLVGEAAARRGASDPSAVAAEFKRRVGDDVPLVVAGQVVTAHDLCATVVRWVVDAVTDREGAAPDVITLTHPAAWGEHRTDLLLSALADTGLDDVRLLPEPQAAALHYASRTRVPAGSTVAVYDLGGGTFDAAVVRTGDDGEPHLVGAPGGLDDVGGADLDDAVLGHVLGAVTGPVVEQLDPAEPVVATSLARLRRECVEAKEALSADVEATVPVLLPGLCERVRLVRAELEELAAEPLARTVDVLTRTVVGAGVRAEELTSVLLVGGASRMPLVAELVSGALGRPVAVDSDPKLAIALGAATAGAAAVAPVVEPADGWDDEEDGGPEERSWAPLPRPRATGAGHRGRWAVAAALASVVLIAVAATAATDSPASSTTTTGAGATSSASDRADALASATSSGGGAGPEQVALAAAGTSGPASTGARAPRTKSRHASASASSARAVAPGVTPSSTSGVPRTSTSAPTSSATSSPSRSASASASASATRSTASPSRTSASPSASATPSRAPSSSASSASSAPGGSSSPATSGGTATSSPAATTPAAATPAAATGATAGAVTTVAATVVAGPSSSSATKSATA